MRNFILLPLFVLLVSVLMLIHPGEPIPKSMESENYLFYLAKFMGIACSVGIIRNIYQKRKIIPLFILYMICITTITSITITVLMTGFYEVNH